MRSKAFYAAIALCEYDVVTVVETWPVPSILETELTPTGWKVFRRNRYQSASVTGSGGSVFVLVRDDMLPALITLMS